MGSDEGVVSMIHAAERLKTVPRLGWLLRAKLKVPESVADHSYALSLLCMVVGDLLALDTQKMVKMALLHDLCESLTGDIQPGDLTPERKHRLERRALLSILQGLPERMKRMYISLFDEFNTCESTEARIVTELDKLEMAAQARIYELQGFSGLDEFWKTGEEAVRSARLRGILRKLKSLS
jgi:putative hydrolase of HD superfamily